MARPRKTKDRIGELSGMQRIELLIGNGGSPWSSFENEDHARAAWDAHRDVLLAESRPGGRPWAYWRWDVGLEHGPFGHGNEVRELIRRGELREDEVRALRETPGNAAWSREAEAAWAAREVADAD